MTLEEALTKLGELEARVEQLKPFETEVQSLRSHKVRLEGDLAKAKDARSTAEQERDELKERVPKDGAVTLTKADSERWHVLKGQADKLGGVDKLTGRLSKLEQLEAEQAAEERGATIRSLGLEPVKLERILKGETWHITGEGDDTRILVSKGDEDVAIEDWAESEGFSDLLNFARLEPEKQGVRALGQAGRRESGKIATPEELAAEKRKKIRQF